MQVSSLKQVRNPSLSNPSTNIRSLLKLLSSSQAVSKGRAFPHPSVTLPLLQITDLKQHYTLERNFIAQLFKAQDQTIKAVDGVSLELYSGKFWD